MVLGHKVAGILIELQVEPKPFAVVGVGVNLNLRGLEFPGSLRNPGGSLRMFCGRRVNRVCFAISLLRSLSYFRAWQGQGAGALVEKYQRHCATIGRRVEARLPGGKVFQGVAEKVDAQGALGIRVDSPKEPDQLGRLVMLNAGEVEHLKLCPSDSSG
jgi:BirA family biotin operon repressor/biotin-[acetyl-CoA-carboxylase] ligase